MFRHQVLLLKLPLQNGLAITFMARVITLIISSQNEYSDEKQLRDDLSSFVNKICIMSTQGQS